MTSSYIKSLIRQMENDLKTAWQVLRVKGPGEIQFWFIALIVGVGAGFAALGFRNAIEVLQTAVYGADDSKTLHSYLSDLSWYWVVSIPVLGGIVSGIFLQWLTPDGRARSVADVIEGSSLHKGRVETRAGIGSALASLVTLSTGGSSGREGPVVHLAGVISTWVSNRINASGITGRDLLGCAVAGAVSASFNAPIAGALFALEVVLRHFAVHAFAPIVIASVAGTVVSRLQFGNVTEFVLKQNNEMQFYIELPAFLILGLISGLVAAIFMRSVFFAEKAGNQLQARWNIPGWLRPGLSGLVLGIMAVWFPHIIGVGYETTSAALTGQLLFLQAVFFVILKCIAVAVTFGGRMGGGIFSPSLMIGAMTGLAFGIVATSIFPSVSGEETLYALAGMGAVAAAVLGAPISTTLIVFELTGDWQTGLAVMVAVSLSTALASRLVDRSFFLTQLEHRNIHLAAGPQAWLLATFSVADIMRDKDHDHAAPEDICWELVEQGIYVDGNATLEAAMPIFDNSGADFIPVVTLGGEDQPPELWGAVFEVDALHVFNDALAETAAEEHS
ncbi:chloride channel protein [Halocynthiibacter sp.]|uniref:chloride channel protein n=1 Tax=Halocynthiibacter sp. TaxID=1979210 RepID=UPI003C61E835